MTIRYVAYTWNGERVEGTLEADSEDAAYEKLREDELIPYRLRTVRQRRTLVQIMPSLFKPKTKVLLDFYRQLASLLSSGIPLRQALGALRDETPSVGLRYALQRIIQDVEAGVRFSDACEAHDTVFASDHVRHLRIGEATGNLTETLEQLGDQIKRQSEIKGKVTRALTYPAITLVVAVVAGFVLVRFSLPALIGLLDEFGGDLPFITRMLVAFTSGAERYGNQVALATLVISVAGVAYVRTERGNRAWHAFLLKTPVVGKVILQSNMFTFSSTLASLLQSGVPTIEALSLVGRGLNNRILQETLAEVTDKVAQGARLGQTLHERTEFPPLVAQGIVTGEMTGSLGMTLRGLADYYESQTENAVNSATELIQPAVVMVVAGIVAFIAIAIVGGLYSTLGSVAGSS